MTEPSAVWVYAVLPAFRETRLSAGVAGAPVRPIAGPGLAALVSDVPLSEFGAPALRANMEDLDWLEATARAHHQVIETAAALGPVVPMRLVTIYRDDGGVLAMLSRHEGVLRACMNRISGRLEWGVKAFAKPAGRPALAGAGRNGAVSGAEYLARRRSELADAEDSRRAAADEAGRVHAGLSRLAVAAGLHPPQDPQLSGDRAPMILNGLYLVAESDTGRFETAVRQVGRENPAIRLELTGPWPPYSFAAVDTGSGP